VSELLMKSTKTYVATSSRSCGAVFDLYHRRRAVDHCLGGRLARLSVPGSAEGRRGGRVVRRGRGLSEQNKHSRPKRPSTPWPRARRRAIACWRGCARRRKSPAMIPSGGEIVRRDLGRSQRRRAAARPRHDSCRRLAAGDHELSRHAGPARACHRAEATFSPYRARIARLSAWRANDMAAARRWLDMMPTTAKPRRACAHAPKRCRRCFGGREKLTAKKS